MWKLIKRILAIIFVSTLTFELLSAGSVHLGVVSANAPSYVWPSFTPFWAATDRHFGMWHPPHAHFNHVKACYNLVYNTNADGARDKERPLKAPGRRVAVLGDSFVEGYGLADADRVSDRLEAETGMPHLNFGTSGGFGPTQYFLQYKSLVKKFTHEAVIINILPDNDFGDDDPAVAEARQDSRYAPYFHTTDQGYDLRYRNADKLGPAEKTVRKAWKQGLRSVLRSFSYGANAIDYFKAMITYQRSMDRSLPGGEKAYSGYFDFTGEQWRRMAFVVNQILGAANGKPVVFTLIPRPNDIRRAKSGSAAHQSATMRTPLAAAFGDLLNGRPNTALIDFLDGFSKLADPAPMYNKCDGHWSPAGAALAAKILLASGFYRREVQR